MQSLLYVSLSVGFPLDAHPIGASYANIRIPLQNGQGVPLGVTNLAPIPPSTSMHKENVRKYNTDGSNSSPP